MTIFTSLKALNICRMDLDQKLLAEAYKNLKNQFEIEVWAEYDASQYDLTRYGKELIEKHGGSINIVKVSDYQSDEDGSSCYISAVGTPPRSTTLHDKSTRIHVEFI